jgi:hypothetical protein
MHLLCLFLPSKVVYYLILLPHYYYPCDVMATSYLSIDYFFLFALLVLSRICSSTAMHAFMHVNIKHLYGTCILDGARELIKPNRYYALHVRHFHPSCARTPLGFIPLTCTCVCVYIYT